MELYIPAEVMSYAFKVFKKPHQAIGNNLLKCWDSTM
jgi:hypothetical protein